ncbi:serine/threonine-protein kinase EDR1 [Andrographis paniculata]|uniref:serine/threonine-protein kinase EDR1 n=1 Tax=Andrographis paniculata TaxID=175694 RepID=UPI0021E799E9|nr:serine/threonine-protein kinase EDR1 [Andrographis paniculata]
MSKVKHLLRKLHIGDHHQHGRPPPPLDPSPQTAPSVPSTSSSPSSPSDLPPPASSSENERSTSGNFNYFEEEFQMQLALAISVSDQGQSCVDPETAQINAAKQISLGRLPSQNLAEFMSLRYWSSNVVNYDEKVVDGFYDVFGIDSNLVVQAKMPSLVELESISPMDDIGCEVVLVNRTVDVELRKLEERVRYMSMECHALDKTLNTSFLVQKIAELIVQRMGGPVSDVEEMFRRWKARNRELRIYLNTIVLPLGSLDIGHSRQRALLFKVLADMINLPCKLVRGSYYTGTDEGAVNLIKLDDGSEYIIDLMGAPGTLIPAEVPSGHCQSFGLDTRNIPTISGIPNLIETHSASILSSESSASARRVGRKMPARKMEHDVGDADLTPWKPSEASLHAAKKKSTRQESESGGTYSYSTSNTKEPSFEEVPVLHPKSSDSTGKDFLPDVGPHDFMEEDAQERSGLVRRERLFDPYHGETNHSLLPFSGLQQLSMAYSGSERPLPEGLGTQLFHLDAERQNLTTTAPGEQNVRVSHDVISLNGASIYRQNVEQSGDTGAMLMSITDQPEIDRIHNVQLDPVLNGVAEILWEDLQIGERIGIGSYGEVYRAEWNGTEVAVKKFMNQDISGDALAQFKCEVEIMLRLRHPNVVLFMGAVIRPPNMSILTEYLPRGSLYKLLHRPNIQIDEKRRIKMALDVAKGMNYLHTSHPTIVHRDLKTPNLLVDKNWVVKVCDFGMSRLQHHTFLSSKSAAGTAEWMAPEVLRNEPSNEKSDVYSFGVILWELASLKVPWTGMNSMQVVGAVGFQGRNLEIPPTVDPLVAGIISDCWSRNPQARPSFAQIITRLKSLQRLSIPPNKSQGAVF